METLSDGAETELVLRNPNGQECVLRLEEGQSLSIGRDLSSDLPVLDAGVSRHHALITREANDLWIEDLHSQNGTFINLEPVHRGPLHAGDVITLGRVSLVLTARSAREGAADVLQRLRPERLIQLLKASRRFASARDREVVLERLLDAAMNALAAGHGAVLLWDEERRSLQPVASRPPERLQAALRDVSPAIAESTLREGKAHILTAPAGSLLAGGREGSPLAKAPESSLIAPLFAGANNVGVLYLARESGEAPFSPADAEFVEALTWIAGPAVEASSRMADMASWGHKLAKLTTEKERGRERDRRGAEEATGAHELLGAVREFASRGGRAAAAEDAPAASALAARTLELVALLLAGTARILERRSARAEEVQIAHACAEAGADGAPFALDAGGELCALCDPDDLILALRLARARLDASAESAAGRVRGRVRAAAALEDGWLVLRLQLDGARAKEADGAPLAEPTLAVLARLCAERLGGAFRDPGDGSSLELRLPCASVLLDTVSFTPSPFQMPGPAR